MDDCDSGHAIDSDVLAALYDRLPDRFLVGPHREYLAADLSGNVLDLGAGTGAMFPYVDDVADGDLEYHAIEPDPKMRRRATRKAEAADVQVHLRDARGESLPYADNSFDTVLSSLVFCTIPGFNAALDEVARVLRPGGELRFLEHVRNDGWRARAQDALTPLWSRAAGGCQLNRATVARFVADDAFEVLDVERANVGVFPATPIVRGRLRRRQPPDRSLLSSLM